MNITSNECAAPPKPHIFRYKCPKCSHVGSSTDLIEGWLCPSCKTDFFLAHYRQWLENDAVRQTNMHIKLLSGGFYERSI